MKYVCTKCKKPKESGEFYKDTTKNLGTYPCKLCVKADRKSYYSSNTEDIKARVAIYRKNNIEKVRECIKNSRLKNPENTKKRDHEKYFKRRKAALKRAKQYTEENKEYIKQRRAEYYLHNREKIIIKIRDYEYNNREKVKLWKRVSRAKRRCNQKKATPFWAELDKIKKFYEECPKGYHVDHIVPVQNPYVCGLHVLSNLQYLTKLENEQKSNKFEIGIDNYTK